jgi:hypothetical protein
MDEGIELNDVDLVEGALAGGGGTAEDVLATPHSRLLGGHFRKEDGKTILVFCRISASSDLLEGLSNAMPLQRSRFVLRQKFTPI